MLFRGIQSYEFLPNTLKCEKTENKQLHRDKDRHRSVDLVGFLPPAVEQAPSFVLNIANMEVIAVVFTKWNPSAAKYQQVAAMENS